MLWIHIDSRRPFADFPMFVDLESSDRPLLQLLAQSGGRSMTELSSDLRVTANAVRQRLLRLMAAGMVRRDRVTVPRGRPSYRYDITERGRREMGSNFADLAIVLWQELRSIDDFAIRRGLLGRIMERLKGLYRSHIQGETVAERMGSIAKLLADRRVDFEVATEDGLPVLKARACPYTELAEQDRSVCALERMLLADLVGQPMQLTQCRLDGEPCCTFQPSHEPVGIATLESEATHAAAVSSVMTDPSPLAPG